MTRHGQSIHLVYSPQSRPTGQPVPAPMTSTSRKAKMFPFACKTSAAPMETITRDPPGTTMLVATARPPEAPVQKTP
jgi:hypothetical protein